MRKLFCDGPLVQGEAALLSPEDLHHVKNVLRMKDGETIGLVDPSGAQSVGTVQTSGGFVIRSGAVTQCGQEHGGITLYMGLAKGDKFDFIVQKAVELGAQRIVPVLFCRCVVKLSEKDEERKRVRWNKIARQAAMQSGCARVPKVQKACAVAEVCEQIAGQNAVLAYELERKCSLKDVLLHLEQDAPLALIVGPEGGIDEREAEMLVRAGAQSVSLGRRILRCETAPLALLSAAQFVRGGMDAPDKEEA